jgi:hypothetical protein
MPYTPKLIILVSHNSYYEPNFFLVRQKFTNISEERPDSFLMVKMQTKQEECG